MAITDPLHYMKAARSRYINNVIVVTRADLTSTTNVAEAERVLKVGLALSDKSHLGKMRDFYPLELFTLKNVVKLLDKRLYADAFYFVPHALLLLVIRVPFFNMRFRMKLLSVTYSLFYEVYTDVSSEMSEPTATITESTESTPSAQPADPPKVHQRRFEPTDLVTFGESSTLMRMLCTIVSLGSAFVLQPENLRTDSLGTHIVEQRIGQGREDGDSRWERLLSRFTRNAFKTLCLEIDGTPMNVPGRLKTAGCRLISDGDWEIADFDEILFSRVLFHSVTEAGRAEDGFGEMLEQVKDWMSSIQNIVDQRSNEIGKLWLPNPAANSAIMARLLKSKLGTFGLGE